MLKHKRWIALLLAVVLAIGAMSVSAFAAENSKAEPGTCKEDCAPEAEAAADTADSATKSCRSKHGHKDKIAEPENAVGKDAAKEIALAEAGVSQEDTGKIKARVTKLKDGTVVYRVSFTVRELWYCFKIDAVTGEILDKTTEDAAAHEAAKAERKDRGVKTADASDAEAAPASRGHRHSGKNGSFGSGFDETVPETEKSIGRKHGAGSKSASPAAEEGSSL